MRVPDGGIDGAIRAGRDHAGHLKGLEQQARDPYRAAGLGVEHGQLGVLAEPAARQVDLLERSVEFAFSKVGLVRLLHDHTDRGSDGPEPPNRQTGIGHGHHCHGVVPPDVTVGVDEVEDGAVVLVVLEGPSSDHGVDEPLDVEVLPSVGVDVAPLAVEEEPDELEPGCSRATTTAITAVAPVAASTTPRDRPRSRDCALALFSGPFSSGRCAIDQQPLLAERLNPTSPGSVPAPDTLCASCEISREPEMRGSFVPGSYRSIA